jgi:hypothetical protein
MDPSSRPGFHRTGDIPPHMVPEHAALARRERTGASSSIRPTSTSAALPICMPGENDHDTASIDLAS